MIKYGHEIRTITLESNQCWRQVGWIDNKSNFYLLHIDNEKLVLARPSVYNPCYVLVDDEPVYREVE